MATSTASALAAIESAVLAGDDTHGIEALTEPMPELRGEGREFAVVDSNVVTYSKSVPINVRNHVARWMLLAQRVASHSTNPNDDPEGWVDTYLQAMTDTGWVNRGAVGAWSEELAVNATMHEKILSLLAVALGPAPAALALTTAAIKSLQSMAKDSPWITLFNRRAESAQSMGFQIADCETEHGSVILKVVDFRVYAEETMTQVLWFKFTNSRATIYNRHSELELSEEVMEAGGEAVREKVLALITSNIAGAQLSELP